MLTSIAGIIAALATIVGSAFGIIKWVGWKTTATPEEAKQNIDKDVESEEDAFKQSGRPQ